MKIGFHVYHFTFRGSEVACYDYALYNESILGNISVIFAPRTQKHSPDDKVLSKYSKKFKIIYYKDLADLQELAVLERIDALYCIKYGTNDGIFLNNIPTIVHCVFTTSEPHGNIYAGVSETVAKKNSLNITFPVVNHIVWLPELSSNYRERLNIPKNAIVLGRHGGEDTFDIPFVKEAIEEILRVKDNLYFIFAVTPNILKELKHPRVIFLSSFSDLRVKRKFINTCDFMIHACTLGESFGLSILEFSYCGKPVITFNGGYWHKQHITNLGEKGILYEDKPSLINILENIEKYLPTESKDYFIREYLPRKIMGEFQEKFLKKSTYKLSKIQHL